MIAYVIDKMQNETQEQYETLLEARIVGIYILRNNYLYLHIIQGDCL